VLIHKPGGTAVVTFTATTKYEVEYPGMAKAVSWYVRERDSETGRPLGGGKSRSYELEGEPKGVTIIAFGEVAGRCGTGEFGAGPEGNGKPDPAETQVATGLDGGYLAVEATDILYVGERGTAKAICTDFDQEDVAPPSPVAWVPVVRTGAVLTAPARGTRGRGG
jgi:hypothetical protein